MLSAYDAFDTQKLKWKGPLLNVKVAPKGDFIHVMNYFSALVRRRAEAKTVNQESDQADVIKKEKLL